MTEEQGKKCCQEEDLKLLRTPDRQSYDSLPLTYIWIFGGKLKSRKTFLFLCFVSSFAFFLFFPGRDLGNLPNQGK